MTAVVEDRRVRRTKAALQQAMVELVVEQGYESISIDALAGRADVTRATFYAHYPSKAALLTAVVDHFADEVIAALDSADGPDGPTVRLEVLLEQARALARRARDHRARRRRRPAAAALHRARRGGHRHDLAARIAEQGATPRIDTSLITRLRAAQVVAAVGVVPRARGRPPHRRGHGRQPRQRARLGLGRWLRTGLRSSRAGRHRGPPGRDTPRQLSLRGTTVWAPGRSVARTTSPRAKRIVCGVLARITAPLGSSSV